MPIAGCLASRRSSRAGRRPRTAGGPARRTRRHVHRTVLSHVSPPRDRGQRQRDNCLYSRTNGSLPGDQRGPAPQQRAGNGPAGPRPAAFRRACARPSTEKRRGRPHGPAGENQRRIRRRSTSRRAHGRAGGRPRTCFPSPSFPRRRLPPAAAQEGQGEDRSRPAASTSWNGNCSYVKESLQTPSRNWKPPTRSSRATNEELQSTNEELQSTNEELETSKEEMQSLNEEMST